MTLLDYPMWSNGTGWGTAILFAEAWSRWGLRGVVDHPPSARTWGAGGQAVDLRLVNEASQC